jgi:hypothetical protein
MFFKNRLWFRVLFCAGIPDLLSCNVPIGTMADFSGMIFSVSDKKSDGKYDKQIYLFLVAPPVHMTTVTAPSLQYPADRV